MKEHRSVTRLSNILLRFKKPGKKLQVTIIGAFGARNVGDLAIMKTIVNDLSGDHGIEYSFASRDDVLKNFYEVPTVNPFSVSGLLKLLRDDAIVVGGGGLYGHETHRYLVMMLPLLRILKIVFRKKMIFYNVGIYNAESRSVLTKLWPVLRRADEIFLRDDSDLEVLPEDIKMRAKVEPDITFLLEPKEPQKSELRTLVEKHDKIVGLSLRYTNVKEINSTHDERIAQTVKEVIEQQFLEKDIPVLFIPFQPIDETYVKHYFVDTIRKFPDTFIIIDTDKLMVEEIKWIIGELDLAIGMRLHFQIFSTDLDTPVIGLSYAPKCTNFLRKSGCIAIDVYNMDSQDLTRALNAIKIPFVENAVHSTRKEQDAK